MRATRDTILRVVLGQHLDEVQVRRPRSMAVSHDRLSLSHSAADLGIERIHGIIQW